VDLEKLSLLNMIFIVLWIMGPAYIANSVAVLTGGKYPIDQGKTLSDGNRILGDGKTWSGLLGGTLGGIAFGLLSFENDLYYNSITFLIVVVILILLFLIRNHDQSSYFYSMIIGGALGNLTDRIRYSSVPDFIDFHISNFHWFVFNIADIFITLGVICLIVAEIFFNKNKINEQN